MQMRSGWWTLTGGVSMAIGSALSWEWISNGFWTTHASGFQPGLDGEVTQVIGVLVALFGVWLLSDRPMWGLERFVLSLLLIVFGFVWIVNLRDIVGVVAELDPYFASGGVDVGIWVMGGGWALATVGILPIRRVVGVAVANED